MPATSQQQQKLFGLALAVKRGEVPASEVSDEVKAIVDRMSEKDIEDFAATKHDGLPKKIEAQIREIVREIMREKAISEMNDDSINEASYNFGKEEYTKKNMTPTQILDLAMAYANVSGKGTNMYGGKMENMIKVANDLAKLNGTKQMDAKSRGKEPALILFLLKNGLVTQEEYVKLYKNLLQKQISVVKTLKNADPASRMIGGAAARQAHKDMRGEFEESVNEGLSKKNIEKLTSYKDLYKFFKANKNSLNKKDVSYIEDEIGALKYLESDYKRGRADREEVLVAVEEIQDLLLKSLSVKERVNEAAGKEAMGIAAFTGTRGDAVQKFIDDNKLDAKKLFNYVKGGKLTDRLNFVTAIVGTPGNSVQKKMIKMFGESVNEYNVNKKFGSKYDIGAGSMGNGTTFWNRAEEEFGEYKKIAHVADNGKITFYDKALPSNVKKHIEDYAKQK